jgi:hypothetical protein
MTTIVYKFIELKKKKLNDYFEIKKEEHSNFFL